MKNMLEHIIRNILTEQSVKVPVVIKKGYGSGMEVAAARQAGAIDGFRVKAIARKQRSVTPTIEQIHKAIDQAVSANPDLKKYATSKFDILRSEDERDSERNYTYNYWIFPYNFLDTKQQSYFKPSRSPDVILSGSSSTRIGVNLVQLIGHYDLSMVNLKSFKNQNAANEYVKWLNSLRIINKVKPIPKEITPDITNLPPDRVENQLVSVNKIAYFFTGTITGENNDPVNGILRDAEINGNEIFRGTFKNRVPFNGVATNLSYSEPNSFFTGQLENGRRKQGKLVSDNDVFEGEFDSSGAPYNGIYTSNGIRIFIYVNGKSYGRTECYNTYPSEVIKWLQEDILLMLRKNQDVILTNLSSINIKWRDSINQFMNISGATGKWDSNFSEVAAYTNWMLFQLQGQSVIDNGAIRPEAYITIPDSIRKQIIQYQTETLPS